MKLPKVVYVRREKDTDGTSYLVADETPDGAHGDKVGVYVLKEVKTLVIKEELV